MSHSRFVLHPLVGNKRSRGLFMIFLTVAALLGISLWVFFDATVQKAGLNLAYGPPSNNLILSILLSSHFRVSIIVAVAIFAAGLTGQHIVGPVKRIEQWLSDYKAGFSMRPLRVRERDKFSRFVELVNRLLGTSAH
jgi:uncharacterized BrkB/YihY/UPF0761 family membrane protein